MAERGAHRFLVCLCRLRLRSQVRVFVGVQLSSLLRRGPFLLLTY